MTKSKSIAIGLMLTAGLWSSTTLAIDHPGCAGKDNAVCDTLAMMVIVKGNGCYRVMKVDPRGSDTYRLTCELASYDHSSVTYTVKFTNNRQSYTVY